MAERGSPPACSNACVVRNPVNLADSHAVPYPCSDVVKMASVARLEAQYKGQDVLFQALSGERAGSNAAGC